MSKSLDTLASYFRPQVDDFLSRCAVAGIELTVIDTDRTAAEQEHKLAQGVSWTSHSKHEPQPPEEKSEAIDVCPNEYLSMKGWNPGGELWEQIGTIGESCGMFWGGRWIHINGGKGDPGHFQYQKPETNASDIAEIGSGNA